MGGTCCHGSRIAWEPDCLARACPRRKTGRHSDMPGMIPSVQSGPKRKSILLESMGLDLDLELILFLYKWHKKLQIWYPVALCGVDLNIMIIYISELGIEFLYGYHLAPFGPIPRQSQSCTTSCATARWHPKGLGIVIFYDISSYFKGLSGYPRFWE